MVVKELIKHLQACNQEIKVVVRCGDNYDYCTMLKEPEDTKVIKVFIDSSYGNHQESNEGTGEALLIE